MRTVDLNRVHEVIKNGIIRDVSCIQSRAEAIIYRETRRNHDDDLSDTGMIAMDAKSHYSVTSRVTGMGSPAKKKAATDGTPLKSALKTQKTE